MRRTLVIVALATCVLLPAIAYAADANNKGFVPLAPIPGLTEGATVDEAGIAAFLNSLYTFCIGLAVVLAIIMIIWGGIQYATQDSPFGKASGKEKIQGAIFGLVLVLSPALVFYIINPNILNLEMSLPPLDTTWGTYSSGTNPNLTPEEQNVCAGYTQFRATVVPEGQYCKDVLGSGWANVGVNCTNTDVPAGQTLCGYNPNYDNPPPPPPPPVGDYYTERSQIPAGAWCYQIEGNTGYNCAADEAACQGAISRESEDTQITSQCTQY